jgi:hypothetical protein
MKFFLPPLVLGAVNGVGIYLALLAFDGNHKAMAIATGVVAIAAAAAFSWTAFKVGLFSWTAFRVGLFRLVTSISVTNARSNRHPGS